MKNQPARLLALVGLVALLVGFAGNGVVFGEQANASFPSIDDRFVDFDPTVHIHVDIVGANGTATLLPFGSGPEPIPIRRYPIHPGARGMTCGPVFIMLGAVTSPSLSRSRNHRSSRIRFRTAIYFHCGGFDLYPATH